MASFRNARTHSNVFAAAYKRMQLAGADVFSNPSRRVQWDQHHSGPGPPSLL